MSYDSALLIQVDEQKNVRVDTFIQFVEWMEASGLLSFSSGDKKNKITMEYFYYDEETDDEQEDYEEVGSINGVRQFIDQRKFSFCSISMNKHKELKAEFDLLLEELNKDESVYFSPAWQFGFGFGNVLDPVAGEHMGWSFYIDASGYIPDERLLDGVFSKGKLIQEIRSALTDIFDSTTTITGCLTG